MTIHDLDTPALLIDLDRTAANLDRAASYAAEHGLNLRPHTKTHKSPRVASMQLDRGADGLTVAKVGEAEIMARCGERGLLVAYPVWGERKWKRLAEIAMRIPVTVALDSLDCAQGLHRHASSAGARIGVLVEADLGMRRCGAPSDGAAAKLAQSISRLPALRLEGVLFYPGHVIPALPRGRSDLDELARQVERLLARFRRDGLPTGVVSGGSTPSLYHSHQLPGLTEIRPGTYVFNDCTQVAMGSCGWDDCAATVQVTVVSRPAADRAVIDGGSKTFTSEPLRPSGGTTYGRVLDLPGAEFRRMNEEHGMIDLRGCEGPRPRIGDRLRIVPNHVCVTVNMHELAHGVRGEAVEEWWPVEARGKIR